jgi:heptosyltransferase-2
MGDVILATAVFAHLEKEFPGSKIHFVTDSRYAELFKDDPRLFSVIGMDKKEPAEPSRFAGIQWDKIIDLQNNTRSRALRKSLNSKITAGIFNKRHFERALLLFARLNRYRPFDTVALRYLEAAGLTDTTRGEIPAIRITISDAQRPALQKSLFSNGVIRPVIALIPFSAWKNKQWPQKYFILVGRYFLSKGWHVVILGGPQDAAVAREIKTGIGERCTAMAGKISLYQSACLLKGCHLALGNDTGLTHLARACGVKTGIIYGSTTFHFGFFPYGVPSFRIFQTEIACRPCNAHGGNFCFLGSRPCLKRTKPQNVLRGLEELHVCP